MIVSAIEDRTLQLVAIAKFVPDLDAAAIGVVRVERPERLRRSLGIVVGVVVGIEAVAEAVVIDLRLHISAVADFRVRQEIEALNIPIGPGPILLRGNRICGSERRFLPAPYAGIAQRIFIGGVRRRADLEIEVVILGGRMIAEAAIFARRRRKVVRELEMLVLGDAAGCLPVPLIGFAADER